MLLGTAIFWELFAGYEGLSLPVKKEACGQVLPPLDFHTGQDLLDDELFNKVTRRCTGEEITWVHMAPPCRTFTRARRTDASGSVRVMRTEEKPVGEPGDKEAEDANRLASRCASLAIQQWKERRYFIENLEKSFMWGLKLLRKLRA